MFVLTAPFALGQPETGRPAVALRPADEIRQTVTLRAVDERVSGEVIRFVAENTEPIQLDPAIFDADRKKTPRQIIERLCGSVRDEYYDAFLRINQAALPMELGPGLDLPLGDRLRNIVWPSCLYVKPAEDGVTAVVGRNESASVVYNRLTGGHATQRQLENFFKKPIAQLARLQPGDVLQGERLTAPVTVTPTGMDAIAFTEKLKEIIANDPLTKVRAIESPFGEIVVSVDEASPGSIASETADCPASETPFDPEQVEKAFSFARQRRDALGIFPGQTQVVIVDNGFYGADPNANPAEPFDGSPFPKAFFKSATSGHIARRITVGSAIWPINDRSSPVTKVSGHGTHVAGIALGGPWFAAFRSTQSQLIDLWMRLTIINVSNGSKSLIQGAEASLHSFLGTPDLRYVVNMSISYDGQNSQDIEGAFKRLFSDGSNTLFLVAAGNRAQNVSNQSVYPAALGGPNAENIITVAALGGDGRLTAFSNHGDMAVDIAAPGCRIKSWLDNSSTETALSGTSQATPFVTFAAAMLRSLAPEARPDALKARLIASGDLLHAGDQAKTAYRTKLNIPKSLLWFDDYVVLSGEHAGTYLGSATRISEVRCSGDSLNDSKDLDALWALKRDAASAWLFAGRNSTGIHIPCRAAGTSAGRLRFTPEYRIDGAEIVPIESSGGIVVPVDNVVELIMRTRIEN